METPDWNNKDRLKSIRDVLLLGKVALAELISENHDEKRMEED